MNRPFDEHTLRDALHSALDETPVPDVAFDRVAAAGRRRRLLGTAGVGVAVVAVVSATSFGLSGLTGPAGSGLGVGAAPASPTPQPYGNSRSVQPLGDPLPSDLALPQHSSAPTPRSTVRPTTAAGWCPTHTESGRIDWPAAHEDLLTDEPEWNGPDDGPFLPFTATRAIVCRYDMNAKLVGAADVTDRSVVAGLQARVNDATTVRTDNGTCGMDGTAFVTFVNRDHGRNIWVDLTRCDAWWMPYAISITGGFADQVRSLTPNGSGRKR